MSDDKILKLTPAVPKEASVLRAAIRELSANQVERAEFAMWMARHRRMHYLAYLKEGFTETQALELCK